MIRLNVKSSINSRTIVSVILSARRDTVSCLLQEHTMSAYNRSVDQVVNVSTPGNIHSRFAQSYNLFTMYRLFRQFCTATKKKVKYLIWLIPKYKIFMTDLEGSQILSLK